ncbi:hypothetical protein H0H93_014453 [Arthromyces matolae]|nr:hypothetical protein H0H93_014453 [Arthromyces matolae]
MKFTPGTTFVVTILSSTLLSASAAHIPKHLPSLSKITPEHIETAKKATHKAGQIINILDRVTQPKDMVQENEDYVRRDFGSGSDLTDWGIQRREPAGWGSALSGLAKLGRSAIKHKKEIKDVGEEVHDQQQQQSGDKRRRALEYGAGGEIVERGWDEGYVLSGRGFDDYELDARDFDYYGVDARGFDLD